MEPTIDELTNCARCGNDFDKGKYAFHLPFVRKYFGLCHICYLGFTFGFYMDFKEHIKKIEDKDE